MHFEQAARAFRGQLHAQNFRVLQSSSIYSAEFIKQSCSGNQAQFATTFQRFTASQSTTAAHGASTTNLSQASSKNIQSSFPYTLMMSELRARWSQMFNVRHVLTGAPPALSAAEGAKQKASGSVATAAALAAAAAAISFSAADAPRLTQYGFQDPATAFMEGVIDLHADISAILILCGFMYIYLLARAMWRSRYERAHLPIRWFHSTFLEIAWTTIPAMILMYIATSSFALLYAEEIYAQRDDYSGMTLKIIGRQWFWSYKYPEFMSDFDGDSYMVPEDELEMGMFRNLEVDNRVVLPCNTPIRLVITGADVIHSWAVPSLGIKCDAIPGRLAQVNTLIKRPGIFYGQCSELCGVLHYAMPICVVALPPDDDLWH